MNDVPSAAGIAPDSDSRRAPTGDRAAERSGAPGEVRRAIAIACQGGGSQAAYTGGVVSALLDALLAAEQPADDAKQWVGISGTSGGAITAIVAWYGALIGGAAQAQRALASVWAYNTAQRPGEVWMNGLGVWALDLLNFDFQLNPNQPPLCQITAALTEVWPKLASDSPALSAWLRPDYFRLDRLITRCVDFEVIAALGRFLAIPAEIDCWRAAAARNQILAGCGLDDAGAPVGPLPALRGSLLAALAERRTLQQLARQHPGGLLARAMERAWTDAVEAAVAAIEARLEDAAAEFTDDDLDIVHRHVNAVAKALPALLMGAVDVGTGEFVAFSSKRRPDDRGITLAAVLASAAVPWLFPGVAIGERDAQHVYWDGLFSQNPPIADFFAGVERELKPDEIWVAQVNPQRCPTKDLDRRLWDRRNELAGNLSLNQEIVAAGAINARIVGDGPNATGDKRVQILRVAMDSDRLERELGWSLGPTSKLDRSAVLMKRLFAHGKAQAKAFLAVRDLVELAWNRPASGRHPQVPVEGLPAAGVGALREVFGEALRFHVSDMTIAEPQAELGGARFAREVLRARLSWHCHVATGSGQRQRLEGIANVGLDADGAIVGVRMTSIVLSQPDIPATHVAVRTLPAAVSPGGRPRRQTKPRSTAQPLVATPD